MFKNFFSSPPSVWVCASSCWCCVPVVQAEKRHIQEESSLAWQISPLLLEPPKIPWCPPASPGAKEKRKRMKEKNMDSITGWQKHKYKHAQVYCTPTDPSLLCLTELNVCDYILICCPRMLCELWYRAAGLGRAELTMHNNLPEQIRDINDWAIQATWIWTE